MKFMASYIQGYDEERFTININRNFLCLICFNVLKDPVLCPRNQHCFCRVCITKHLANSQKCPTCADKVTVESLAEPQRMIKDYLDELNIHCVYIDRGCEEIVQLQHLDKHEATCGFTPAVCTNPGCGATLNQRDLINHESELCEFRKLKCHSCGQTAKTLADMEKRMSTIAGNLARVETSVASVERNVATNMEKMATVAAVETCMNDIQANVGKQIANVGLKVANVGLKVANVESKVANIESKVANIESKVANVESKVANVESKVANVESKVANVEIHMERNTAKMEGKLETVNNQVTGSKTALIEAFNEMKDVLVKMDDQIEENARKVRNTPSGDRENIIVAGGFGTDSVELFDWRRRTWSPLQSLSKQRCAASSFVYHNHVTIAGGYCSDYVDDMIRMNINPNPDPSTHWSNCPVKLRRELAYHSSVLYNDQLIVTGGFNGNVSDCIDEVQLTAPYTVKALSRMPELRMYHGTQLFDDSLLIVGGSTSTRNVNSMSSVVLYDIKKNECQHLAPLPYEVSEMATVRWGDNIIVIGGVDKHGKRLDTVIIYNIKTEQSHMLPPMRFKRGGCTAVVIGNNIVVLGGDDEQGRNLKSVEAFNFQSYTWQELPEMSQGRWFHTAVVV